MKESAIPFIDQDGTPRSGVPGVIWRPNDRRWAVTYFQKYLGQYKNLDEAIAVRKAAEAASKSEPKICKNCGKPIPAGRGNRATTCSRECARIQKKEYERRYFREHKPPTEKKPSGSSLNISFYASPEIKNWIKNSAKSKGESVSEFLRTMIQREMDKKEGTE